jgi:GxxExxY protein
MPVEVDADLRVMEEGEFKELAYAVMKYAFKMHNEYGNCFAENLYRDEIAAECQRAGFREVQTQVPIIVKHGDFQKRYFPDLLVEGGALFEFKVASGLCEEHRAQVLNYLFLMGLPRAKLVNLGAASVEHKFVSTQLTLAERRRYTAIPQDWKSYNKESSRFFHLLLELIADWGCFLQLALYQEALTHFFGGESKVIQDVPVIRNGVQVATRKLHLWTPDTAFKITGFGKQIRTCEEHLRRLLHHTPLRLIQWVNLHQTCITFKTLVNNH